MYKRQVLDNQGSLLAVRYFKKLSPELALSVLESRVSLKIDFNYPEVMKQMFDHMYRQGERGYCLFELAEECGIPNAERFLVE